MITIKEEITLALQDTSLLYDDGQWCLFVDFECEHTLEVPRLNPQTLSPIHWTA